MPIFTIRQAKANLAGLIRRASEGEEIIIARGSKPVARLAPIGPTTYKRRPGALKGKLFVGPEFFEALPANELSGLG